MIILGLNSFHANSAAVILVDGKVEFAIEEERINRIKNSGGFPKNSIIECLNYTKKKLSDIDFISLNSKPSVFLLEKIFLGLKNLKNFHELKLKFFQYNNRLSVKDEINKIENLGQFRGKYEYVEHHLSHISSSFFQSNFREACGVSIDGSGDFTTTSNAICFNNNVIMKNRILYPHSLGIFYTAITNYLGYYNYGEEYKVMAMGAFGDNSITPKLQRLVNFDNNGLFNLNLDYFVHQKNINTFSIVDNKILNHNILNEDLLFNLIGIKKRKSYEKLTKAHFNLAKSLQDIYEQSFFNYLNFSQKKIGFKNLCLAGGCAMNSLANGKIKSKTKFKKIFIQPASYDAGSALGAAKFTWNKYSNTKMRHRYYNYYFGSSFTNDQFFLEIQKNRKILKKRKITIENFINKKKELIQKICNLLIKKKIIGIFRERMEWGARALGNRSIIADPRGKNIKKIINYKIKRRESFRPFAPMILKDLTKAWFGFKLDVPNMMEVYKIKPEKKIIVPAVVHCDDSCRLQTVDKNNNVFIYNLLKVFYKKTKVPLLLNTSFNENEPIVHTPNNALKTFLRTKMDVLVLGDYLLKRKIK